MLSRRRFLPFAFRAAAGLTAFSVVAFAGCGDFWTVAAPIAGKLASEALKEALKRALDETPESPERDAIRDLADAAISRCEACEWAEHEAQNEAEREKARADIEEAKKSAEEHIARIRMLRAADAGVDAR